MLNTVPTTMVPVSLKTRIVLAVAAMDAVRDIADLAAKLTGDEATRHRIMARTHPRA